MTVRPGMWNLIDELRLMTNAGEDDFSIGGVTYWQGEHLQAALDRRRRAVVHEELHPAQEYGVGTVITRRYYSAFDAFEATTGGTAVFVVHDATGAAVGTALYTPDYNGGEVIFSSDTGGSVYYLTGHCYDLNAAAADVWERKATQMVTGGYRWSSDNMTVDKTGMRQEAINMARYYRSLAGPTSITMTRGDTDVIDR